MKQEEVTLKNFKAVSSKDEDGNNKCVIVRIKRKKKKDKAKPKEVITQPILKQPLFNQISDLYNQRFAFYKNTEASAEKRQKESEAEKRKAIVNHPIILGSFDKPKSNKLKEVIVKRRTEDVKPSTVDILYGRKPMPTRKPSSMQITDGIDDSQFDIPKSKKPSLSKLEESYNDSQKEIDDLINQLYTANSVETGVTQKESKLKKQDTKGVIQKISPTEINTSKTIDLDKIKEIEDMITQEQDNINTYNERLSIEMNNKTELLNTIDDQINNLKLKDKLNKKQTKELKDLESGKALEKIDTAIRHFQEFIQDSNDKINKYQNEIDILQKGSGSNGRGLYDTEINDMMRDVRGFKGVYSSDEIKNITPTHDCSFIYNTDTSNQPGKHWIAVRIDDTTKSIEHFDPLADEPNKYALEGLKVLMDKIKSPYLYKFKINNVKNQKDSTDTCGYQCMRFILDRNKGLSFKEATHYVEHKQDDKTDIGEKQANDLKNKFGYI